MRVAWQQHLQRDAEHRAIGNRGVTAIEQAKQHNTEMAGMRQASSDNIPHATEEVQKDFEATCDTGREDTAGYAAEKAACAAQIRKLQEVVAEWLHLAVSQLLQKLLPSNNCRAF